ncbi:hypothetical protein N864_05280 [Intrasporangium chromatireducens Q5-1]|uniref:ANTAR domain-containing protein n=1 Tax=Intrasporangium chromatireducens Q5-1 TaxID=584657 RepID=W9GL57_9MICO|nr:ANTAR domain-containing protein [Intrasporangium chromatireducens]EWT04619.1 hypothetical protein N864_05280 [Intrasporangium chromatireducens Q5-1]
MGIDEPTEDLETRRRLDELTGCLQAQRGDIDALIARGTLADSRADASEALAAQDRRRLDDLEARAEIDREIVAELQTDGMINREQVAQLQEALRTSRTIGAAMGIVMSHHRVSEDRAFDILREASNHSNRKLRSIAEDLVLGGDVSQLPAP